MLNFFLFYGRLDLLKDLGKDLSPKFLSKKYTTYKEEREDKRRDEKWKKKDFARKEDWEIFAENRDRKHVSFSKTPIVILTPRLNHNRNQKAKR